MISQAEIARFHTKMLRRLSHMDPTFQPRYLDVCKLLLQTNRFVAGSTFRYVAGKCGILPPPGVHYTAWHACESVMSNRKKLNWMVPIGKTVPPEPTNHNTDVTLYMSLIYWEDCK